MVETADRDAVGEEPRGDPTREWEVFVREDADEPLRHVGSVSAPDAEIANEQASRLFAWYAEDLWVCPADEVRRFSTHDLVNESKSESDSESGSEFESESESESEAEAQATDSTGSESEAVVEEDRTTEYDADDEPRVTEL